MLQHPAADVHDHPGLLRDWDELERRYQAACGVSPADETFKRGDLAGAQVEHRLIVQLELATLGRPSELGNEPEPGDERRVHAGLEVLVAAGAGSFCLVHRDVGIA